ncbi:MAG: flagellar hook-associated protein FlgK [Sedimentisphaerales bacterium]|jgi:flagellar hook-associated protein FlgK|nr:flagellar hook-associated protein FlgK [Sedimentisphaerales bacterium]HNY79304.1 flagellar hook-associated protein FlgK [Sedimentisphaerales bacterium]HOC64498.1 flagellar hook-associated protein FlgK [Sedimentisphaerales bacterium]HOH63361.1 flagellar hook-associated protein FlgK [Sedimentisphaerales bacterium]HPY48545.1 flagellar hook-associated protein FlgK [Sedimentisphaerales bacterium]
MENYSIGLSGLNAVYAAMEVIGNNIANASTEGYHRQRIELRPADTTQTGRAAVGAGVDVVGVTRLINGLLEREITAQGSSYGQISQELSILSSVETSLGEFAESGGLNETLDAFFDALHGLAANPLEQTWRNQVVSSAEVLTAEFRRLGSSLASLEDQMVLEAQNVADSINLLTTQIAELNGKIRAVEINGGQANNLRDNRDQRIVELAQLTGIETQTREYGGVDVSIGGLPVVTGAIPLEVSVSLQSDGSLALHAAGSEGYGLAVQGGRLGGLLSLRNELLPSLEEDLDTLARGIVSQINAYHVQGVGIEGSFTELDGWTMGSNDLNEIEPPITDGTFYIRVTNTETGEITRHAVDVNLSGASPDTLDSIAAKVDAIDGLTASVGFSRLHIASDLGYEFDFTPALLPEPTASNLTAAAPPAIAISGIYNEDSNETLTFTVDGSGAVGNGALRLTVTAANGDVVTTLNIGSGYAAGDVIEMTNGVKIAVSTGDLNDGDRFEVEVFQTTDTTGFLAAVGMNTFLSGTTASDMEVCARLIEDPDRIATALGGDLSDNGAALRMSGVHDEAVDSLGGMTPNEYYQRTTANLGQEVALKQSRQEHIEAVIEDLKGQQSDISGVNINDEAAQLIIFEKMFQAIAKYFTSLQTMITALMEVV